MSDVLRCYWCSTTPVVLGQDCPKCGVPLEIIVPPSMYGGNVFVERACVGAYKDLILQEDHRVLSLIESLSWSSP